MLNIVHGFLVSSCFGDVFALGYCNHLHIFLNLCEKIYLGLTNLLEFIAVFFERVIIVTAQLAVRVSEEVPLTNGRKSNAPLIGVNELLTEIDSLD